MSRFQNLVAAEVTRLKHSENQSLLTSAATVLKEPLFYPCASVVNKSIPQFECGTWAQLSDPLTAGAVKRIRVVSEILTHSKQL